MTSPQSNKIHEVNFLPDQMDEYNMHRRHEEGGPLTRRESGQGSFTWTKVGCAAYAKLPCYNLFFVTGLRSPREEVDDRRRIFFFVSPVLYAALPESCCRQVADLVTTETRRMVRSLLLVLPALCVGFSPASLSPGPRGPGPVQVIDVLAEVAAGALAVAATAGVMAVVGGGEGDPKEIAGAPAKKEAAASKLMVACWSGDAYKGMAWSDGAPRKRVAVDPRPQRAAWSGSPYASTVRKSVPPKGKEEDAATTARMLLVKAALPTITRAPAPNVERVAWSGGIFESQSRASLPAPRVKKRTRLLSWIKKKLLKTETSSRLATNQDSTTVADWRKVCDAKVVSYTDLGVRWN